MRDSFEVKKMATTRVEITKSLKYESNNSVAFLFILSSYSLIRTGIIYLVICFLQVINYYYVAQQVHRKRQTFKHA